RAAAFAQAARLACRDAVAYIQSVGERKVPLPVRAATRTGIWHVASHESHDWPEQHAHGVLQLEMAVGHAASPDSDPAPPKVALEHYPKMSRGTRSEPRTH